MCGIGNCPSTQKTLLHCSEEKSLESPDQIHPLIGVYSEHQSITAWTNEAHPLTFTYYRQGGVANRPTVHML